MTFLGVSTGKTIMFADDTNLFFSDNCYNQLFRVANEELINVDQSAAWRSGSERRFYDDHDRMVNGSPPNLVSLLRPWIRCFTMITSAWWSLASSK